VYMDIFLMHVQNHLMIGKTTTFARERVYTGLYCVHIGLVCAYGYLFYAYSESFDDLQKNKVCA